MPSSQTPGLISDLLELVDLSVKRESMVNELSRGMKQRLSLARALVHDPAVLILDEPASGLYRQARIELRNLILQLRDMGKTLVISSHILAELEDVLRGGDPRSWSPSRRRFHSSWILEGLNKARQVRVTFLGGESEMIAVADEAEQAAVLKRLMLEDEREVIEFTVDQTGLEQLFMQVTEGIVQ